MTVYTLPNAKRDAEIYVRHQAGETLSAIARSLGLSTERVRQVVSKAHRRQKRPVSDADVSFAMFPPFVRNRLKQAGITDFNTASRLSDAQILSLRCGTKSLAVIRQHVPVPANPMNSAEFERLTKPKDIVWKTVHFEARSR